MSLRRRVVGVAPFAAAAMMLTAGCALGPQHEPVAIARPPARSQPSHQHNGGFDVEVSVRVYLVHDGSLVQVRRTAQLRDTHLQTVLGALFQPLRFEERNEGLRTALPAAKSPVPVHVRNHLATVQLPVGFDELAVSEQIQAMGQMVFTICTNSDAFRVQFMAGDKHVAVPDGSGRLLRQPVTRADYVRIAP